MGFSCSKFAKKNRRLLAVQLLFIINCFQRPHYPCIRSIITWNINGLCAPRYGRRLKPHSRALKKSARHAKFLVACVAWRFVEPGAQVAKPRNSRAKRARTSGKAAPISSRFLCPRPPLLLSAPNQNRHATQAKFLGPC